MIFAVNINFSMFIFIIFCYFPASRPNPCILLTGFFGGRQTFWGWGLKSLGLGLAIIGPCASILIVYYWIWLYIFFKYFHMRDAPGPHLTTLAPGLYITCLVTRTGRYRFRVQVPDSASQLLYSFFKSDLMINNITSHVNGHL